MVYAGERETRYCGRKVIKVSGVLESNLVYSGGDLIMSLYNKLINKEEKISLIGLGYVGMPIAVAFAKKVGVLGFDINRSKIDLYKAGIDPTKEVGNETIKNTTVEFTSDEAKLREAKFHIIAVPTPVSLDHTPDLRPIESASRTLGRNLVKGSIVVYESTVYPGVTEDICVKILEKESGLKCGVDFKVGYSPERINPGDKTHRLETIVKIVSGMDEETLDTVAKVYELVVEVGVHRAESIKVAEAAKVIENSQRDINIAFMNELSIIFNRMGIDTQSVLKAAGTKWNFLKFHPGLVGGHCIGVDPYYLTHKAEQLGYHSQIILSGRRINDDMGKYVAENIVKNMIKADKQIKGAIVAIFGITFKENCPDVRNTKVIDVVNELKEYGINVVIIDPVANNEDLQTLYGIKLKDTKSIKGVDAVVFAVPHEEFKHIKLEDIKDMYNHKWNGYLDVIDEDAVSSDERICNYKYVLADIKGIFDRKEAEDLNYLYWRL
jgi:UDP-N-acetyl-D-galactosamine dehydrogenase